MIAFDNVAYSYGGGELLSEITLRLAPGSFHFLTGPSGAGKSTTARLWQQRGDATVLCDDRIIVRQMEGAFRAYGTPWHGDIPAVSPASAPLERILFIRHGAENRLTPLRPAEYLAVKALVAVCVVVPAVGIIYAVAAARGVHLDANAWALSSGLLLAALAPMIVIGLVIGVWFNPEAANPATTLTMLALSMLGGLWFDITSMPAVMQDIAHALPSYWALQFAQWPVMGGDFPVKGVAVIAIWTIAACVLGALGYRRAVRTSKR